MDIHYINTHIRVCTHMIHISLTQDTQCFYVLGSLLGSCLQSLSPWLLSPRCPGADFRKHTKPHSTFSSFEPDFLSLSFVMLMLYFIALTCAAAWCCVMWLETMCWLSHLQFLWELPTTFSHSTAGISTEWNKTKTRQNFSFSSEGRFLEREVAKATFTGCWSLTLRQLRLTTRAVGTRQTNFGPLTCH